MSEFLAMLNDTDAASERTLPVERLSPSSIEGFMACPERWRREKVAQEPRFSTADQLFGSAFHRAAERNYAAKIETHEDVSVDAMRDIAGDSFTEVVAEVEEGEEIRWYQDNPNDVQQGVIRAMVGAGSDPGYHQVLAPTVQPIAVERWVEVPTSLGIPLVGRIDVETDKSAVIDLKTSSKAKTQGDLDKNIQATANLWMRQQEESPADNFMWHTVVRLKTKTNQQELGTVRTAKELETFEQLLVVTANTIHHYMDTYGPEGPWPGTSPLSWFCTATQCSFWSQCVWRGGSK